MEKLPDGSFPKNTAIHIHSMEEAWDVINYYEDRGYFRRGLTPNVFLDYPFFMIAPQVAPGLITGDDGFFGGRNVAIWEYDEWLKYVGKTVDFEVCSSDDLLKFIRGDDGMGNLVEKILKQ